MGRPELGPWRVRGLLGLAWGGSKVFWDGFWLGRGMGEGLKVHRVAGVLLKCDPETKNPGPQK